MLESEVSSPARRERVFAVVAVAFALSACIVLVALQPRDHTVWLFVPTPVVVHVPQPVRAAKPAAPPQSPIDEPIKQIAAAADAPVIALASEKHVWISRDDGKTFSRALDGMGHVSGVFVEPTGRVYALREDSGGRRLGVQELGIAELDGSEHWRQPPDGVLPLAARNGWLVGMANQGGMEIGWNAGDAWDRVPASRDWNPWRMTMGKDRTSRFLASHMGSSTPEGDPALYLLAAHEGGRASIVWSTPYADTVGSGDIIPCAGFAGDTLHVVVRDRQADASGWHHGKLVTVTADGKASERVLVGQLLDDAGMTCEITGNDRAAFLVLHSSRTLQSIRRIDRADMRESAEYGFGFDQVAVDAHGQFMFLAHGCVTRINEAGNQSGVACGPDRR